MGKEIIIAGLKLKNDSVTESLAHVTKNYQEHIFTTIEEVDMRTILLTKEDATVREVVESVDMTVLTESGILDAAGQGSILRRAEIDRREFFFQFMKITERNGYTIYIVGETEKEIADVSCYIEDEFPRIKVAGTKALGQSKGIEDAVINEINMVAPDVMLCILPSPKRESFLKEYKSMLFTKIWYGADADKIAGLKLTFPAQIMKFFRKLTLKQYLKAEYSKQNESAEKEDGEKR